MNLDILIIDDEAMFRQDLATLLVSEGYTCDTAASGEEGLELAQKARPAIVLTDLVMPGIGGLEVVDRLAAESPKSAVIVVTAFGSLETAVDAFRLGAVDYVLKPIVPEDVFSKVRRIKEFHRLESELHYLRRAVSRSESGSDIVGKSRVMEEVRELIVRVAPAPSPVLILGPTGTGKELVARAIHNSGAGEEAPFVPVNCAAWSRELIESELFGHARGAFTGAVQDKPGVFEIASGGTLFLDEVGEFPVDLQPKLLRAIEEKRVTRVGGTRPIETPVRVVAATNRDLRNEVEEGRFREDLFFRLNVVEIRLPPLKERREDIPLLIEHLVSRLNVRLGRHVRGVDADAVRALMSVDWPGNVRELENLLERAMLLSTGEVLNLENFRGHLSGSSGSFEPVADELRAGVKAYEAYHIHRVLADTGGNREEAARRMGIDPSTLYRRLKELDLQS